MATEVGRGAARRWLGRPLRRPWAVGLLVVVHGAAGAAVSSGCGGTNGHEDLPAAPPAGAGSGVDAGTQVSDGLDATAPEFFDVAVPVTDRELPDLQAPPVADAMVPEAGSGLPPDAASPCTSPPCGTTGPNSVLCYGNDGGVCTQAEAMFVDIDIVAGEIATSDAGAPVPGPDSCYTCLLNTSCIDDDVFGDACHDCQDVSTMACLAGSPPSPPPLDGVSRAQSCLDTLSCILGTNPPCGNENPPATCFCGTASGTACLTAGAANGACLQQEINGLEVGTCTNTYPAPLNCFEGDPTESQEVFTNIALPAGMANVLVGCAFANCGQPCGL